MPDPFDIPGRVVQPLAIDAARSVKNAIALRVQQTISSLPPSSPQPFVFQFDPDLSTWTRSERAPPAAFLVPDTLPPGALALRISAAYFELRKLDEQSNYVTRATVAQSPDGTPVMEDRGVFKFGVTASARAEIVSVAASYGLTPDVEIDLDVPIAIVTANAGIAYSATIGGQFVGVGFPILDFAGFTTFPSIRNLEDRLGDGSAFISSRSLSAVGISGPDGSTEVGLSRVGIASKFALLQETWGKLAFQVGVSLPSPSADQLAGTDTTSIYPRFIASSSVSDRIGLFADVGYDYDFDEATLRRFAWSTGASYSSDRLSLDFGVNGSLYQEGIQLFRPVVEVTSIEGNLDAVALDEFKLPTNLVDLVFGITVPLGGGVSISGTATVPIVNVEFRPEAIGVVSAQYTF